MEPVIVHVIIALSSVGSFLITGVVFCLCRRRGSEATPYASKANIEIFPKEMTKRNVIIPID